MESRKAKRKAAARQQKSSTMQKTLVIGSMGLGVGVGLVATTTDAQAAQREWQANTPQQIKIIDGEGKYQIQWGDTLWAISQATNIPVDTLMQTNQITDRDAIFEGNTLSFSKDGKQITVTDEAGETIVDVAVNDEGTVEVVEPESVVEASTTTATAVVTAETEHQSTILVRHVNEEGQEISAPETIVGVEGQSITVAPKEIEGFAPVDEPQTVVIEGNSEQTIIYQKAPSIAVTDPSTPVEPTPTEVTEPNVSTEPTGKEEPVSQEEPQQSADVVNQTPSNEGQDSGDSLVAMNGDADANQNVVQQAPKAPEAPATLTIPVSYVEEGTGQTVKSATTITGEAGSTVAVATEEVINDYQLVGNTKQSATFGKTSSVKFIYRKKPSFAAYQSTVTVYYLDELGQTLGTDTINRTVTQAGQMETLNAKAFNGYSLISNSTQQIALDSAAKAVTFIYQKDAPAPVAPSPSGNSIVSEAYKYIGVPYVWGGRTPSGFDCSGLTRYVYQQITGQEIGYNTVAQENAGTQISVSQAQAGDLLFWGNKGSTYHVAIYIGNNQAIHAPQPGENVSVVNLNYFKPDFAVRVN